MNIKLQSFNYTGHFFNELLAKPYGAKTLLNSAQLEKVRQNCICAIWLWPSNFIKKWPLRNMSRPINKMYFILLISHKETIHNA